jgi:hypothetical protein
MDHLWSKFTQFLWCPILVEGIRGLITAAEFRDLAHLSNSSSDKSLTSRILGKWKDEGKVVKMKRGTYKFTDRTIIEIEKSELLKLIKAFSNKGEDDQ